MSSLEIPVGLDQNALRSAIADEYTQVATAPDQGFHFHTGRKLAGLLDYDNAWIDRVPESSVESFAGTGNPFRMGQLKDGEQVLDVGSGAGMDSLIAGQMVGPGGHVTGVDMTDAMLARARTSAEESGAGNVEFVNGDATELPPADNSIDVVISNGVFNLVPAKARALQEMYRVLKPGGRLQIADIVVSRAVPFEAKEDIDLWTG